MYVDRKKVEIMKDLNGEKFMQKCRNQSLLIIILNNQIRYHVMRSIGCDYGEVV